MLPLLKLDDQTFEDIVLQARNLIPKYAPEWTDENYHDPGITFVELFAWYIEMQQYYLNRITDKNRLKFLKLLGVKPRLAMVAQTKVAFQGVEQEMHLLRGTKLRVEDQPFETDGLLLLPTQLENVLVCTETGVSDVTAAMQLEGAVYDAFGPKPELGNRMYLAFSAPFPVNQPVTLTINLRDNHAVAANPVPDTAQVTPSTQLAWSYCTDGEDCSDSYDLPESLEERWMPVTVLDDETLQLTRSGTITIMVRTPMERMEIAESDGQRAYWICCELQQGGYEVAPQIESIDLNVVKVHNYDTESEVLTCSGTGERHQAFHLHHYLAYFGEVEVQVREKNGGWRVWPAGARCRLVRDADSLTTTLVFSHHYGEVPSAEEGNVRVVIYTAAFAAKRDLGLSSGLPYQRFTLTEKPLLTESLLVQVGVPIEGSTDLLWQDWKQVDDLNISDAEAQHYWVDVGRGDVVFGNDEYGKVPDQAPGHTANIRVLSLKTGGGVAGNIKAHVTWDFADHATWNSDMRVINRQAAIGGRAPETIDEAEQRAREMISHPPRAVTDVDLERLASTAPGCRITQVKAISDPNTPLHRKVVVRSYSNTQQDQGTNPAVLQTVSQHVEPCRLLGTQLEVVGPMYVTVTVDATVVMQTGSESSQEMIIDALNRYFSLTPGVSPRTWELGDTIYRGDLFAYLSGLPGVAYIQDLTITAPEDEVTLITVEEIQLPPDALVRSDTHRVRVVALSNQ